MFRDVVLMFHFKIFPSVPVMIARSLHKEFTYPTEVYVLVYSTPLIWLFFKCHPVGRLLGYVVMFIPITRESPHATYYVGTKQWVEEGTKVVLEELIEFLMKRSIPGVFWGGSCLT